jgi:hypothetical protein
VVPLKLGLGAFAFADFRFQFALAFFQAVYQVAHLLGHGVEAGGQHAGFVLAAVLFGPCLHVAASKAADGFGQADNRLCQAVPG